MLVSCKRSDTAAVLPASTFTVATPFVNVNGAEVAYVLLVEFQMPCTAPLLVARLKVPVPLYVGTVLPFASTTVVVNVSLSDPSPCWWEKMHRLCVGFSNEFSTIPVARIVDEQLKTNRY